MKISIIIPIYNKEKYIERCINSVINQTYSNLEIILVNDGSKDRSGEVCDEYKKKDSRIVVIHKENGGCGSARNCGIDAATGEYIMFIDGDDYIENEMCEILYDNITSSNTDICACFFKYKQKDGNILYENYSDDKELSEVKIYNGIEFLELLYRGPFQNGLVVSLCNKIYKKELFNDIRLKEGIIFEDDEFCTRLYNESIHVKLIPKYLYTYVFTPNSITTCNFNENRLSFINILDERAKSLKERGYYILYLETVKLLCNICPEYYLKIKRVNNNFDFKIYKHIYNQNYRSIIFDKKVSLKDRIRFSIFYISPVLYKLILKCIN